MPLSVVDLTEIDKECVPGKISILSALNSSIPINPCDAESKAQYPKNS